MDELGSITICRNDQKTSGSGSQRFRVPAGTPISAPPLLVQIGSGYAPLNGATPVRQTGASSLPSPRAWSETAETRHEAVFSCKPFTTNYLQSKYINRSALKFYGLNERHWGLTMPLVTAHSGTHFIRHPTQCRFVGIYCTAAGAQARYPRAPKYRKN